MLEEPSDAGFSRTPFRLACRTQTVLQYRPVPSLSGLFPPSPATPGSGCPQLQSGCCDIPTAVSFHHRTVKQRLVAHEVAFPVTGLDSVLDGGRTLGNLGEFPVHGWFSPSTDGAVAWASGPEARRWLQPKAAVEHRPIDGLVTDLTYTGSTQTGCACRRREVSVEVAPHQPGQHEIFNQQGLARAFALFVGTPLCGGRSIPVTTAVASNLTPDRQGISAENDRYRREPQVQIIDEASTILFAFERRKSRGWHAGISIDSVACGHRSS
jgi:hypothetical protein